MGDDVKARDFGGARCGLQHGGDEAQCCGFAGAVDAEQAVDLARHAGEGDVIDGVDFAALFVFEDFG